MIYLHFFVLFVTILVHDLMHHTWVYIKNTIKKYRPKIYLLSKQIEKQIKKNIQNIIPTEQYCGYSHSLSVILAVGKDLCIIPTPKLPWVKTYCYGENPWVQRNKDHGTICPSV
jgi:hypothetical protein